ncbi:aminotransferase class III-fold pyridoxal phosphate-dependent enzyme [Paenibacillus rigui]|uniref:Aminotransferase class III n=1 Tax=Paenibacillus rigui TaxID=554312 RepID=A0A229UI03_9BACL|nr:aminotransferase class III-fold pyridoxal phosphate-dependent enzyme [Paenibacillus rigui]OXM83052.1 aminotransferase class III [Paenibacillus rigui]
MGTQLWKKAKRLIPGGNQLLSKRSERFLPELWPAYYEKAKGCEVWDIEGRHFYDFAQMGVGACVLGYADEEVNHAVIQAINKGSMCTLNCYEEVELAEKLIALHPWSDQVRFARSGGEACAIAVRLGRAVTGKSKVAFCGYHGWHDWYLSANLGDSNHLDDMLLPGLKPLGVPREMKNTAFPFYYNQLAQLEKLVEEHGDDLGVIIMEPRRETDPEPGFLQGVRAIADKIGAVLIFDEITSGFRMNLGGIHLTMGVNPDIAIYGKALGNGFAISAVIGRKEVMESAQDSFISSTFWTERIGYAAALAVLNKMEKHDVPAHLVRIGEQVADIWRTASRNHQVPIHISGIAPLLHISFQTDPSRIIKTLYTQEMLEKGFLASNSVYASYAYTDDILQLYRDRIDEVFAYLKAAIETGNASQLLKAEPAHDGFQRLT